MAAKRDMTDRQFLDALKRNGFSKPVLFWVHHKDLPDHSFPMVVYRDGRIAKRATISRLIKRRDEEIEKQRQEAKRGPTAAAA